MIADSFSTCYDKRTPNGNHLLKLRVAQNLTQSPKVYTVNIFDLYKVKEHEEKVKILEKSLDN